MGKTVTGKMIGGRTRYNAMRTARREERRRLIMGLLVQGPQTNRSIQNWLRENYPSLPRSKKAIQLDLVTIRAKWVAEGRCPDCR